MKKNLLVCSCCGSLRIQVKAWVDANTLEYHDATSDGEDDDNWCEDCEDHQSFVSKNKFEKDMRDWAKDKDIENWKQLSYDEKRAIYNKRWFWKQK